MSWVEQKLGELVTLKQGFALNAKSKHYIADDGIPLLKISDLFNNTETLFVNEQIPKQFLVFEDEIIYTRTAQVGYAFMGKRGVIYNNCFKVIPDEDKIDKEFLYLWLNSKAIRTYAQTLATGTAQQDLNHGAFKSIKITLPPLKTQQKIASLLSNYDKLIENNTQRIKALESMAEELYKEWFVRLRFPGHEDVEVVDGVPKGWERKALGDCVNNFDNKRKPLSQKVRETRQGKYPYYGAASILDYIDNYIFDGQYLLVGEDGTVITKKGTAMLQFITGKFWVSNHAHVLTGKLVSTEYLYLFLNLYPILGVITGAAQPKINQKNLNNIKMIVPTSNILNIFDKQIIPIFKEIFLLKQKNITLKQTRDLLLPRLMSGKLYVEDLDII